jgi:multicomponent Na+:H+ antiporter subunit A
VPSLADPLVQAYATGYDAEELEPLKLWHGLTLALLLSVLTIAAAAALFLLRDPVRRAQRRAARVLGVVDAEVSYERTVRGVDRIALRSTAVVQPGSLPVYLAVTLLTLVALPGTALALGTRVGSDLTAYDRPLQLAVAVVIAVAAVSAARAHRRFTAVLLLGAVGYGTAVLFVLQGGPDLALTQFLVETLSIVIFMFVLRRLPANFTRRTLRLSQLTRAAIGAAVGVFVFTAVLVMSQARTAPPASQAYLDRSYDEGGGSNVVNVVLVDFRGFDTLGEITVLAVAAMGIASLVLAGRTRRGKQATGETALTPADGVALDEPDAPPVETVRS